MTWRQYAKPIIHKILKENQDKSEKEINKLLRDAYPFGEREYYPYKVWLDEIKKQKEGFKQMKEFQLFKGLNKK